MHADRTPGAYIWCTKGLTTSSSMRLQSSLLLLRRASAAVVPSMGADITCSVSLWRATSHLVSIASQFFLFKNKVERAAPSLSGLRPLYSARLKLARDRFNRRTHFLFEEIIYLLAHHYIRACFTFHLTMKSVCVWDVGISIWNLLLY